MGKLNISMPIFHSYANLPEGNCEVIGSGWDVGKVLMRALATYRFIWQAYLRTIINIIQKLRESE